MLQLLSSIADVKGDLLSCKTFSTPSTTATSAPVISPSSPVPLLKKPTPPFTTPPFNWKKTLRGEEKELFERFTDANQALSDHSCCEYFSDGFRLGARLMLEVMQPDLL